MQPEGGQSTHVSRQCMHVCQEPKDTSLCRGNVNNPPLCSSSQQSAVLDAIAYTEQTVLAPPSVGDSHLKGRIPCQEAARYG
eukprot:1073175-Pelagomonas_calceolata.AAC.1